MVGTYIKNILLLNQINSITIVVGFFYYSRSEVFAPLFAGLGKYEALNYYTLLCSREWAALNKQGKVK